MDATRSGVTINIFGECMAKYYLLIPASTDSISMSKYSFYKRLDDIYSLVLLVIILNNRLQTTFVLLTSPTVNKM